MGVFRRVTSRSARCASREPIFAVLQARLENDVVFRAQSLCHCANRRNTFDPRDVFWRI